MLRAKLKAFALGALPSSVVARLDPIEEIIRVEVLGAARATRAGEIVLDAGAGEARHRRVFERGTYVALDSTAGDRSWDYSRLDVIGSLEALPVRSGAIDRILCMVVLEHVREPRRALEEIARALKPGGSLHLVVPLLWEEHQAPHDYFRFTRYGIEALLSDLPFEVELLRPMGGFFWVCARRSVNFLGFLQGGWRWPLFVILAPFFGLLFPLVLYYLDGLDRAKAFSLGFQVRVRKTAPAPPSAKTTAARAGAP